MYATFCAAAGHLNLQHGRLSLAAAVAAAASRDAFRDNGTLHVAVQHPKRVFWPLQWAPRPEGAPGEALLAAGWFRFLAAPQTYWDHRRPASAAAVTGVSGCKDADGRTAESRDGAPSSGGSAGGVELSTDDGAKLAGSGSSRSSGGSPRSAAAASSSAAGAGADGFDFSHQHDPVDRLALAAAPLWVRQRMAAMDRDPDAAKVDPACLQC